MGDRILGKQVQKIKQILEQSKVGLTGRGRDVSRESVSVEEHHAPVLLTTPYRIQGPKGRKPRKYNKRFVASTKAAVGPYVTELVSRVEPRHHDLAVSRSAQSKGVSPLLAISSSSQVMPSSPIIARPDTSNYVDFAIKIATLMKKDTTQTVGAKQEQEKIPSVASFGPPPLIFTTPTRMPSKPDRVSKQEVPHRSHKLRKGAATTSASLLTSAEYVKFAVAITSRLRYGF
jgi:hypothetical protein